MLSSFDMGEAISPQTYRSEGGTQFSLFIQFLSCRRVLRLLPSCNCHRGGFLLPLVVRLAIQAKMVSKAESLLAPAGRVARRQKLEV